MVEFFFTRSEAFFLNLGLPVTYYYSWLPTNAWIVLTFFVFGHFDI